MKSLFYLFLFLMAISLNAQIEEGSTWAILNNSDVVLKFERDTSFYAIEEDEIYEDDLEFKPLFRYEINRDTFSFLEMFQDTPCGDAIGKYLFRISNDTLYFDFSYLEDECLDRVEDVYYDKGFFKIELQPKKTPVQGLQPPFELTLDSTRWWLYNYPKRYRAPIIFRDSIMYTSKFFDKWYGRFHYLTKGDTIQFYEDIYYKDNPRKVCDSIGLYTFEISNDTLQFFLIADDCSDRIPWFEDVFFIAKTYADNPDSPSDYDLASKPYTYEYLSSSKETGKSERIITTSTNPTFPRPTIYPNPSKNNVTLNFSTKEDGYGEISITDQKGRIIFTQGYKLGKGKNSIVIDTLGNLPAGVYFITLQKEDEELYWTDKIILSE